MTISRKNQTITNNIDWSSTNLIGSEKPMRFTHLSLSVAYL